MNEPKDKFIFHTPQLFKRFPGLGSLYDSEDCAVESRYIQRIDEMERIIRFLLEELTKADSRQLESSFWEVKPSNLVKHLGHILELKHGLKF